LCSAKALSQEDSKFAELVLQGEKKAQFFISNAIILQSMYSNFLKPFPNITLMVQSKSYGWISKNKNKNKFIFLKFLAFFWKNYAIFDLIGEIIISKNQSMNTWKNYSRIFFSFFLNQMKCIEN
jgi:hypothetical protein